MGASMLMVSRDAGAQSGATQKPMPNVLLLVDTSGSMERMTDNTLPAANSGPPGLPNACSPGVESNPNRWGMLVQALTGNMQPFYSCAALDRSSGASGAAFRNEYKIAGVNPYDTDYLLPYHRPLTGALANLSTCAIGPHKLPGGVINSTGVGPSSAGGYSTPAGFGGDVRDFPDDALVSAKWPYLTAQYAANSPLPATLGVNGCIFDQARDGQLDAARDYVRFALMTFDNDNRNNLGVNSDTWPPQGTVTTGAGLPFLGQWSYRRDPSNPDYNAAFSINGSSEGLPNGCAPPMQPFEVGARHWGAPPWEGRMVEFPAEDATLFEIQRTNEDIQKVLLSTRPYGATPIDGMMDDARDYFWHNTRGPVKSDDYVKDARCREQYIILLTDGAPNLDLRPACVGGICPYPNTASATAASLYADTTKRVTTFVIGFSVNGTAPSGGDGFPAPYNVPGSNNCKSWYGGVGGTPTAMAAACASPVPPSGSTAEACCELNRIAYEGSGGASAPATAPAVGPFFAESQADIVLSFGRILASITKAVSTRTVPTFTPAVYSSTGFGTGATTAQYIGSFIPNAQKPWSGEILRERSVCTAVGPSGLTAVPQPPVVSAGDSMAVNLAAQSAANRWFITVVPDKYSAAAPVGTPPSTDVVDAARTVRPFAGNTDGIPLYSGTEYADRDWNLKGVTDIRLALEIDKTTCKRGRAPTAPLLGGTKLIPALDLDSGEACTDVIMGFATAHIGTINPMGTLPGGGTGTYEFNIRCNPLAGTGTPSAGKCSISGLPCDVTDAAACPTIAGQVCVPECAPLGAIFRANPVVNGPPDALLRDAGYRAFQARRSRRKPTLFAATTDGILHGFKAVEQTAGAHHELWSFIPPAILPRLASNYPAGNQILLDGSPIVKDTVWERSPGDLDTGGATSPGAKWHTTLVAGLGAEGGGYYAVNVTDSDCNALPGTVSGECSTPTGAAGYEPVAKGVLAQAGAGDYDAASAAKRGPHFLWQLTDIPKNGATDPARVVRRSRDAQEMVSLFGRHTGTPAITTLQLTSATGDRQVGVAILPGGIDGPPVRGQFCPRTVTDAESATDPAHPRRTDVRRWGATCTSAVPGRGVTIVRLDTGEIVRHFGRTTDVPQTIANAGVVTNTQFDAPMVGTPVVYPQTVGAVAQKIFIGDADGSLWRIDMSSNDPAAWRAYLFADLFSGGTWADSQPIANTPIISLDPGGSLIINVATGDQENVIYKVGERNYVWSIQEQRPTGTSIPIASVKWFETFNDGARVTGPMTVFDRTLYFASFAPRVPALGQCENAGTARLWGLHYYVPDVGGKTSGGMPMWCGMVGMNGICSGALTKSDPVPAPFEGYLIPGVTLRATQACSEVADLGEGNGTGFQSLSQSQFTLSYGVPKARTAGPMSGLPPSAMTNGSARPLPRVATTVNAWALVTD